MTLDATSAFTAPTVDKSDIAVSEHLVVPVIGPTAQFDPLAQLGDLPPVLRRALIIVDVQNDFCEGGALAIVGGTEVARRITETLESGAGDWDYVVATRDFHVDPGEHFSPDPDFRDSWPPHCVANTSGAELHPELSTKTLAAVFDKGAYAAAYSGFEGKASGVELRDWLTDRQVREVDIVGLATDYCVRATALDAARYGFAVTVLLNLTAGAAAATTAQAVSDMREAGIRLLGEVYTPEPPEAG